jgi:hypothetical protein
LNNTVEWYIFEGGAAFEFVINVKILSQIYGDSKYGGAGYVRPLDADSNMTH